MNRLNVFNQYYCQWKYPSNWKGNIRLFFRQFKWAWQRATRGYCDSDVWDLDTFYLDLFYATLIRFADTTNGYPGTDEFPTPESWDKYLRDMAIDFYRAQESNDYYAHPAEDAWWEEVQNETPQNMLSKPTEKSIKMCAEAADLAEKRTKDVEAGLKKMNHVFFNLWD